jgi:transposase
MGEITLTVREEQRLVVFNALERSEVTMAEAARLLRLSVRQVRRLRAAYRRRGARALVHGNRGRPSRRRLAEAVRRRIVHLARSRYAQANHVHLQELLARHEGLHIAYTSLRRILHAAGLRTPRTRRPPRHRTRRERLPQEGMLVQFDGSHHDWLQGRGPKLVLHAAVDDATGKVLGALLDDEETAWAYLHVFRQIALGPGLPLAAYTDKHGIFKRNPKDPWTLEEQLRGHRAPTQVGRVLAELGIEWIPASSPQAKGRIERLFGTFQDRLVTELRLAGIRDKAAANAFLPEFVARHNARFARSPAQPKRAYRPWPKDRDPETVFCFKYSRTVAQDHTVTLGSQVLQIVPHGRSYAKARVEIHERLDGTLAVIYQGHPLASRLLTLLPTGPIRTRQGKRPALGSPEPKRARPRKALKPKRRSRGGTHKPSANHPWRQFEQVQRLKAALRQMQRTNSLVT